MRLVFHQAMAKFDTLGDTAVMDLPPNATIHSVTNDGTYVWVLYSTERPARTSPKGKS